MASSHVPRQRKAQPVNLFVFGLGYSALAFISRYRNHFVGVCGTVRSSEKAAELARDDIEALVWNGAGFDAEIARRIAESDEILISVPPDSNSDPCARIFHQALQKAPLLRTVVYCSTLGVYGDRGGEWVDETSEPAPGNARSRNRALAEQDWTALCRNKGIALHILRIAGIYGPGRSAINTVLEGRARRIVKPGQVFNRIHVADIARTIAACLDYPEPRGVHTWNVADDAPAPPQDVIAHAAALLGKPLPPLIEFEQAELSPMSRSFYAENKRASNKRLKEELGVTLAYPSYREGLRAIFEDLRNLKKADIASE